MILSICVLSLRSAIAGSGSADGATDPSLLSAAASESAGASLPASSPTLSSGPASPTVAASPTLGLTGYVWPLKDPVITLPFGPTSWGEVVVDGQLFHDGVDMATWCGDYVYAAHDGVVLAASRQYDAFIGWIGDLTAYHHLLDTKHWWNSLPIVIVIDDGDGYRSIYAHESKVTVKPGQHVTAGQVIGYEGATGNATGCHVHFGLFSPTDTATFETEPSIVAKDLVPAYEIARINPLLVLPFRCDIEEMRTLLPVEAASCPPLPSPSASVKATPTARPATPTRGPSATPTESSKPSAAA